MHTYICIVVLTAITTIVGKVATAGPQTLLAWGLYKLEIYRPICTSKSLAPIDIIAASVIPHVLST